MSAQYAVIRLSYVLRLPLCAQWPILLHRQEVAVQHHCVTSADAAPPMFIATLPLSVQAGWRVPMQRALLAQQEAQLAEQQRMQAAAAAAAVAGAFEQAPAAQPSPAAAAPVQPSALPAATAPLAQPLPNGLPSTRALSLLHSAKPARSTSKR